MSQIWHIRHLLHILGTSKPEYRAQSDTQNDDPITVGYINILVRYS